MEAIARIAGVGEAGIALRSGRPAIDLAADACMTAVADSGLELPDIDGLAIAKGSDLQPGDRPSLELADYLGIELCYIDNALAGGASALIQIGHAANAIAAGRCRNVLVVYSSAQATNRQRRLAGLPRAADDAVAAAERAAGLPLPIGPNAMAAALHMHRYKTTSDHLAAVAISDRTWAGLNPAALRREPLTLSQAREASLVAAPLRTIDCCLITDGAGAVVVSGGKAPVGEIVVGGFAEYHKHSSLVSAGDLLQTAALRTGPAALAEAGATVADVGLVQLYDAFTILPIVLLENLGFVAPGAGGPFVLEGNTLPGGQLPMNTQGGGLAHCHPGSYGIFLVIEAVRQLRGNADQRQVADPRLVLVQGAGGGAFGGSQATLVMGST